MSALFKESDEASLRRNPIEGLLRGDLRYASQFGDYVTPAHFDAEIKAARSNLQRLGAIDRDALDPTQRIAYDVFRWQNEDRLKSLAPEIMALTVVRPIDHKSGFQAFYPDISSGRRGAQFKTVADYDNGLSRMDGFVVYLDNSIVRFREGMASGVVQPKLVVDVVAEQLSALIAQGVEKSPFYKPLTAFPEGMLARDRTRLTAAYQQSISSKLIPAMTRLRAFLVDDYRKVARDSVGLGQMKGGDVLYRHLVHQSTTLPL
jgi:uncharacterized protein (DUF885 family)